MLGELKYWNTCAECSSVFNSSAGNCVQDHNTGCLQSTKLPVTTPKPACRNLQPLSLPLSVATQHEGHVHTAQLPVINALLSSNQYAHMHAPPKQHYRCSNSHQYVPYMHQPGHADVAPRCSSRDTCTLQAHLLLQRT